MAFIEALVNNFIGYDLIIFLLGVLNGYFFFDTRKKLKILESSIYKQMDISLMRKNEVLQDEITKDDMAKIKHARGEANGRYSLFANFITIFPLLGLLGTVISLVMVAGDGGFENAHDSFMMSLTSTFWGIVFAIGFKVCDSTVSAKAEQLNNDANRIVVTQED